MLIKATRQPPAGIICTILALAASAITGQEKRPEIKSYFDKRKRELKAKINTRSKRGSI